MAAAAPALAQAPKTSPGLPWTQWGGPHRNFQTDAAGIKDRWPASGPKVVWKRPLGEGYSSPAVENGLLYTMYGKPGEEIVISAEAATGKALIDLLRSGHVGHYATDVFAKEPVPQDEPLLKLDNVTLTAHAGYNTPEAAMTMYRRAIDLAAAG